mmetsp:Transcript_1360/g.2813  ORF Transcript_1360/g.2813 Transcript_1360/m.2813 type:complete len:86 (+) Transcript_1360:466-723(+)
MAERLHLFGRQPSGVFFFFGEGFVQSQRIMVRQGQAGEFEDSGPNGQEVKSLVGLITMKQTKTKNRVDSDPSASPFRLPKRNDKK